MGFGQRKGENPFKPDGLSTGRRGSLFNDRKSGLTKCCLTEGKTAELMFLTHIEIDVANTYSEKAISAESIPIRTGGSLPSVC